MWHRHDPAPGSTPFVLQVPESEAIDPVHLFVRIAQIPDRSAAIIPIGTR